MISRALVLCAVVFLGALSSFGAICTKAEVDAQVAAVANGGTITLTAACTTSWSSRVQLPNTKGFTIDGNGATINTYGFELTSNASTGTRITNFVVTTTTVQAFYLGGAVDASPWRVDHMTISNASTSSVWQFGHSPGLFDNNTITGGTAATEYMHGLGWGAGDDTGWTTAMPTAGPTRAQGTPQAIFFEDNTFAASSAANANNTWTENFYGFRGVWRYNTFTYWRVDVHGGTSDSVIGGRWWEFYNNNFVQNAGGNGGGDAMNLRDGSGIVFGNLSTGTESSKPQIGMCNERPSSYPSLYQIGRGTNQALDPAYAWSNQQTVNVNSAEALCTGTNVQFNRDVYTDVNSASCTGGGACTSGVGIGTTFPVTCTTNTAYWKTDAGGNWDTTHGGANDGALYKCVTTDTWTLYYTPYTYPHPLQGCTADHLVFSSQPVGAVLNATLGTVSVSIVDSSGTTCTGNSDTITLSKNGSATWGTLVSGTNLAKAATAGVATWTDLSVTTTAGTGTIDAAASGMTGTTSNSITITAPSVGASGRMRHVR